jgi:prophage tail gpP-like protein
MVVTLPPQDTLDEISVDAPATTTTPGAAPGDSTTTTPPQQTPEPLITQRFGSKEVITLQVNGQLFTNWTSVRVEQKVTSWFPTFSFECSEDVPIPLSVNGSQFVPGDIVRVYVGGVPAVYGYITERHVGYDAKQHGIRLIGVGRTADLTNSCVPLSKLNGHDGQTWTQLANDITAHLGIQVSEVGAVDSKPFEKIAIQPGDTIQSVLERYARGRNIVIGSDPYGALLAIGENQNVSTGDLIEGVNILRANCALRDDKIFKKIFVVGQGQGSDDANGDAQNKQVATRDGTSSRERHMVVPYDLSEKDTHGVDRRAQMEKLFTEGSYIEAQITVQGFFKDSNQSDSLWRAGEYYNVNAPMLILLNTLLGCSDVAFEQSDAGSTTTLTMMLPIYMNGLFNFRGGEQFVQNAGAGAVTPAVQE